MARVPILNPRAAEFAYLTGHDRPELLVISDLPGEGVVLAIYTLDDLFNAVPLAEIPISHEARIIAPVDVCEDGWPEVLVASRDLVWITLVRDEVSGFLTTILDPSDPQAGLCPRLAEPCNGASEPDCSPRAEDPGIQACIEAVLCRRDRCSWAACMLYEYGDDSWFEWVGKNLACAAVSITERLQCVIPPGTIEIIKK